MKLLLADDEKELTQAIQAILEHSGYDTDVANDGEQALHLAQKGYYDAFIFDIMMPKMDGVEVLSTLREEGDTTPALLLTAKAQVEDRVAGLNAGADDYLTKPFAMKELIARISAMTRRKEMMAEGHLQRGNITLVRSTMEMKNDQSGVRLSQYEFNLIAFLFENPNKNIEKKGILEKIWREEEQQTEDGVHVYLAYLKNKLAALDATMTLMEDGGFCRLEVS